MIQSRGSLPIHVRYDRQIYCNYKKKIKNKKKLFRKHLNSGNWNLYINNLNSRFFFLILNYFFYY